MPDDFRYDVFLSHSAQDKAVVRPLAERLRADGLKVWFDEWVLKPGDSIPAKIEEGLEQSRVLVLCMSAQAFGSDWAQLEAGTFRFRDPLNQQRRFIPLRLDDAPIKGSLAQFLYINWLHPNPDVEYARLLTACRGDACLSDRGANRQLEHWSNETENSDILRALHDPDKGCIWCLEFEERRGEGYLAEEIQLIYSDEQSERYDSQLGGEVLEFFGRWRQLQAKRKPVDLKQWEEEDWGKQVRLETVSREHLIHHPGVERVAIRLSPTKYLYYVGIQQQLAIEEDDGLKEARKALYLSMFWNSQIVFEGERFDVMSVRRWRDKVLGAARPH